MRRWLWSVAGGEPTAPGEARHQVLAVGVVPRRPRGQTRSRVASAGCAEVGALHRVAHELAVQPSGELPHAVSLGHPSSVTGGCDSGSGYAPSRSPRTADRAVGVLEPEVVTHAGESAHVPAEGGQALGGRVGQHGGGVVGQHDRRGTAGAATGAGWWATSRKTPIASAGRTGRAQRRAARRRPPTAAARPRLRELLGQGRDGERHRGRGPEEPARRPSRGERSRKPGSR